MIDYPVIRLGLSLLMSGLVFGLVAAAAVHFAVGNITFGRQRGESSTGRGALVHLSVLGAAILVVFGLQSLVDRYGQRPVAAASALVLAASGVFAFNAHTLLATGTALVLLGLGWNLGLVSGSAMLTDHTPAPRRASIQGTVDVLISLSGAAASALAAAVMMVATHPIKSHTG